MTAKRGALLLICLIFLATTEAIVCAQCPVSVLTTGLKAPTKMVLSQKGNLLVAEEGEGLNTGLVSIVDPNSGSHRTLISGLPSGFSPPNNDPSGPSGLAMSGRTLYVAIGGGDAVIAGPLPNSFVPNPSPSSNLFSSILAIHFSANVEKTTEGFVLSSSDRTAIKNGETIVLNTGAGDSLSIRLVVDFPDYVPEPRPGLPEAVRQSNPFGIALKDDHLYVADASSNIVRDVNLETRTFGTLASFAPLLNNRGFGPPVVEAVPDSVHIFGDQLLVTLLTGFPFPIGNAQVRSVDLANGTSSVFLSGLTSAIDVLQRNGGGFLTLEFSTDMLNPTATSRLSFYDTNAGSPVVLASCLITPTSMVQEGNQVYVTEIFTGRIMKVSL